VHIISTNEDPGLRIDIISTDEDPGLRKFITAKLSIRGVSTNKTIITITCNFVTRNEVTYSTETNTFHPTNLYFKTDHFG
jgi:hypothetical protein